MTWPSLPPLSTRTAYLLLVLLGLFGAHQFYLSNGWRGGLYLFTAGGLGIGVVIDLCTLSRQVKAANGLRALGLR